MKVLEQLESSLPAGLTIDEIRAFCPEPFWRKDPLKSAELALRASGFFDSQDYCKRYPDVLAAGMDPVHHFLHYGMQEKRTFRRFSLSSRQICPYPLENACNREFASYAVVVPLHGFSTRLTSQYHAIMGQSVKPCQVIYLWPEAAGSDGGISAATGARVRIIRVPDYSYPSLIYALLGTNAEYVAILDERMLPGEYWFANALRASAAYDAVAASSGAVLSSLAANGLYLSVSEKKESAQNLSCSDRDAFCDWGTGSLVFKRNWLRFVEPDPGPSGVSPSLAKLQADLYLAKAIKCVVPMQPDYDARLHAQCFQDDAAEEEIAPYRSIWRKALASGYTPVQQRENLYRFHVISTFGNRKYLARCIRSLQGQIHTNYTCTLIDDCCDGYDPTAMIRELGLDRGHFRYMRNKKKLFMLAGPEYAIDMLNANPSDAIVFLDGDDWFAHPHVLSQLNAIFRLGRKRATYGNSIQFINYSTHNFKEFMHWEMSYDWNTNHNNPFSEPDAIVLPTPVGRLRREQLADGWGSAPWCHFHTRSLLYTCWYGVSRRTFAYGDGKKVHSPSDTTSLIPMFDKCGYDKMEFVDDPSYIYQNVRNTSSFSANHNNLEHAASSALVTHNEHEPENHAPLLLRLLGRPARLPSKGFRGDYEIICDSIDSAPLMTPLPLRPGKGAIFTIVQPEHLGRGLLSLASFQRNCGAECAAFIIVINADESRLEQAKKIFLHSNFRILTEKDLGEYQKIAERVPKLDENLSGLRDDILKIGAIARLLELGFDPVIYLDTSLYTVANIDDIYRICASAPLCIFPDFSASGESTAGTGSHMLAANETALEGLRHSIARIEMLIESAEIDTIPQNKSVGEILNEHIANVHINTDSGIGFFLGSRKVSREGMIGPLQRSCLLDDGRYIRLFRADERMRYCSINPVHVAMAQTELLILMLFEIRLFLSGNRDLDKLEARIDEMIGLALNKKNAEYFDLLLWHWNEILDLQGVRKKHEPQKASKKSGKIEKASPRKTLWDFFYGIYSCSCVLENAELISAILRSLFPDNMEALNTARKIEMADPAFVTEKVLLNPEIRETEKEAARQTMSAGERTRDALDRMRGYGVQY